MVGTVTRLLGPRTFLLEESGRRDQPESAPSMEGNPWKEAVAQRMDKI